MSTTLLQEREMKKERVQVARLLFILYNHIYIITVEAQIENPRVNKLSKNISNVTKIIQQ